MSASEHVYGFAAWNRCDPPGAWTDHRPGLIFIMLHLDRIDGRLGVSFSQA